MIKVIAINYIVIKLEKILIRHLVFYLRLYNVEQIGHFVEF